MATRLWLRAETKPHERRTALTPASAAMLVDAGFAVTVERSNQSCFATEDYSAAGCRVAEPGTWVDAVDDAIIMGLKELPESERPLRHRHIYFAHAYKEQAGWQDVLGRFVRGGGELFDIEFLVDENGRRVAAFGYWAGFAGAAVAVKTWCGQQLGRDPAVPPLEDYASRDTLVTELRRELAEAKTAAGRAPTVIVIGALGHSGSGACDLAKALDLEVTGWDMAETAPGGPFAQVLQHDIFINCVLVFSSIPPFVTRETIAGDGRALTVVCDVSCDPFGDYNPVPLYTECTTFEDPAARLIDGMPPLDLVAIDHLPSMLPRESSEDFSDQLLATLLQLGEPERGVWGRALETFKDKSRGL
jgi:hypothetical protein